MSHVRVAFATFVVAIAFSAPATALADIPPESAAMIQKVNEARHSSGLPPLQASDVLTDSASHYARYMLRNDYFGHLSSIHAGGNFVFLGETLEWHSGWRPRVALAFASWMASPSHRAVLMSPTFRSIGTGRVRGRWGTRKATAWVAHLGGQQAPTGVLP